MTSEIIPDKWYLNKYIQMVRWEYLNNTFRWSTEMGISQKAHTSTFHAADVYVIEFSNFVFTISYIGGFYK